jgi:hypothetical protein
MTLSVKPQVAEHLYDVEELTTPSVRAQLNDDKMIATIVKACRESSLHVPVLAMNKMKALAFLCKHCERISRPLSFPTPTL